MMRSKIATIAIMRRIWIRFPALRAKYPVAQTIIRITPMMYNKFFISFVFRV